MQYLAGGKKEKFASCRREHIFFFKIEKMDFLSISKHSHSWGFGLDLNVIICFSNYF